MNFYISKSKRNAISKHLEVAKLQNFLGCFSSTNPTGKAYSSHTDTPEELLLPAGTKRHHILH